MPMFQNEKASKEYSKSLGAFIFSSSGKSIS
jgi:hypothetical protein